MLPFSELVSHGLWDSKAKILDLEQDVIFPLY